jgi:exonuclease SbcC
MLAQGEFMELLLASSKDRVEIFRDLFQTGEYEKLQRMLGEETRRLETRLHELDSRMDEVLGQAGVERILGEPPTKAIERVDAFYKVATQEKKEVEEDLKQAKKKQKALEEQGAEYFKLEKELLKEKGKRKSRELAWKEQEEKASLQETRLSNWEKEKKQEREEAKEKLQNLSLEKQKLLEKKTQSSGWEKELFKLEGELKDKKRETEEIKELLNHFIELAREEKKQAVRLEKYEKQQKKEAAARELYLKKEELYRSAAIGLAARFLEEGKPCPVCGSLSHPNKAKVSKEVPDQQEVEKYKKEAKKERALLDAAFVETTEMLGALKKRKDDLEKICKKKGIFKEEEGQKSYELLKEEEKALTEKRETLRKREKEDKSLEKELSTLEKKLETLKEKIEKGREKEEKEALTLRERLSKEKVKAAEKRTLFEEGQKAEKAWEEKIILAAKKLPMEIGLLEQELKVSSEEVKALEEKRDKSITQKSRLKTAKDTLKERLAEYKELEDKYGIWKDLDDITRGKNKDRLVFEQYVLAVYFEEVLAAANLRFSDMTSGRYELRKVSQVGDGRTTNSLDLEMLDNYTGKCRSVKSLSGGEAFKAALCLALGMADMIEASIGGIQLDTLFIDEGFGSLDEESLDQALKSLLSLTGQKHFIGIISHVHELKERLEQQIVIEKGRNGSRITNGI